MLIGAYYYAWYSYNWLKHTIRWMDRPLAGEYCNTQFGPVLDLHMDMAKKGGIDFLSISWHAGQNHDHMLDAVKNAGLKATYFYESLQRGKDGWVPAESLPGILEDMRLVKDLMTEECWLKIDGRPVLMIYVTRAYKGHAAMSLREIRKVLPDAFLVGDELWWDPLDPEVLKLLDATTWYNMYQPGRFQADTEKQAADTYLESSRKQLAPLVEQCKSLGVNVWGCAMPGYDDRGVRPGEKHIPIPRLEGEFFKRSLVDALNLSHGRQATMVTSFNEVYEDSQIEPCQSYGNKYLEILSEFKRDVNK